jgi:hypothetical protein
VKRSRLRRGRPLQQRTQLKQGKPLERKTPLKPGPWRRDLEQWSRLDQQAHAVWKGKVMRARCVVCLADGLTADRHPRRDAHHVLPAQRLRRYVRARKLPAEEAATLRRSLLNDVRNGVSLCRRCHDRHESAHRRVPRELLPGRVEQFAVELGLAHVLDRIYGEA